MNAESPQATPTSTAPAEGAPPNTQLIALERIFVAKDRQRKDPGAAKPLADLKRSILSKGLLHAPVLASRAEPPVGEPELQLVAGERRLLAIRELHQDGLRFMFNGTPVPSGFVPYVLLSQLSPADLEEAELEENILRVILPWPEEAEAKLKIHALRKAQNPQQTLLDTGKEIAEKSQEGVSPEGERNRLSMAAIVSPYMNTPMVKSAKSLKKAYQAVLKHEEDKLKRDLRKLAPRSTPHKLLHGDFFEIWQQLPRGYFDLILSDPPYGIAAHQQSFETKHAYDDSPEYALNLYREILVRGWHLLKPQGAVFLFCDIEHFKTIRTYAESMAYSTWRTPYIWHKGNEGPAPWGRNGFQRTYEIALYAVKGQRGLIHGPEPDLKLFARANRQDRKHAAEKPHDLLRYLLQLMCATGNRVLDPCAGSGPLLAAAKDLGLELTLLEKNEDYYNQLCVRAQEVEESTEAVADQVEFTPTLEDMDDEVFK